MVTMALMANRLNVLSAQKQVAFNKKLSTPMLNLLLNANFMKELHSEIKESHAEQSRNNPLIAKLFNTHNSNKRKSTP